jgi:hypothetical protein
MVLYTPGNQGEQYTKDKARDYVSYYYETSNYRPLSYGISSANFDGAGGSYGIIQFNWKSGTCQPIFKDMFNLHPDIMAEVFTTTADYNTFYDVVFNRTTANQILWGDSITILNADGTRSNKIKDPWAGYFVKLGTYKSYQDRQDVASAPYWNNAKTWSSNYGLWTRRGYTLMLDIAVQFGGISTAANTDILNFIAAQDPNKVLTPELRELRRMRYIASRCAQDHSGGAFSGSAFDRKLGIANGQGTVYGGFVTTQNFDCVLEPNGINAIPEGKKPRYLRHFRALNRT